MQKKNRILSIFLCLALIMSIIPMGYISASAETTLPFNGNGSSETPYLIEDVDDLEALATYVNDGNDCKNLFFKQTANITVENFEPIGWNDSGYYYFNGTYDGDNNEINGTIGAKSKNYQALFGLVGFNGTIKNVINNANVTGSRYVGGIVAYNNGTIKNVINNADVKGSSYVGGIVGYNSRTITNCYNTGNVTGDNYVGGVVGDNNGTIENCYNTGTITGTGQYVGGVVGLNGHGGTITNCYNIGDVEGHQNVGGVVGENWSTITNCYNTGAVKGTDDYVGGVAGYNDNYGTITNCYNTGTVEGTRGVGGVVGGNNANEKITNCYNTGDVEGVDAVGGVAGATIGTITNCYNTGAVTGDENVGGVAGGNNANGKITNCYYLSSTANKGVGANAGTATIEIAPFDTSGTFEDTTNVYESNGNLFDALNAWVSDNNAENKYTEWVTFGGHPILPPFEEDGTVSNPYQISTPGDLIILAQIVNNGGDCNGKYFIQTADITVENFEPIGSFEAIPLYFDGTYDGDNNEINGTIGDKGYNTQALFGFIGENGTIKNVINNADITGYGIVGGVVGHNNGTIKNCYNTGNVTATNNDIGGVVGDNFGTIENCYNTGNVTGIYAVGGIVGYNNGGVITNCYNTGAVEGNGLVGGVAGCNFNYDDEPNEIKYIGTITNCFNTGAVKSAQDVGGIAFNTNGIITNCYFNKEVFISEDTAGKTTLEMSTQDFVDLLNGEDGTAFSFKDDADYLYYPYLTSFGEDSAVVSKEKVQYPITAGDNQKVEIGTDGTLSFTSEGEFGKFKALYLGDEIKKENLVADTNYTAVSGSTKITLNADYVKTLPLGEQTFTLEFVDGYSVVNLEVIPQPVVEDDTTDNTDKPTTDDTNKPVVDDTENPKTDASSNFAFISILALISVAGVYGVKRKLNK